MKKGSGCSPTQMALEAPQGCKCLGEGGRKNACVSRGFGIELEPPTWKQQKPNTTPRVYDVKLSNSKCLGNVEWIAQHSWQSSLYALYAFLTPMGVCCRRDEGGKGTRRYLRHTCCCLTSNSSFFRLSSSLPVALIDFISFSSLFCLSRNIFISLS